MNEQISAANPPRDARPWSNLWPFVVAVAIAVAVWTVAAPSIPVIESATQNAVGTGSGDGRAGGTVE